LKITLAASRVQTVLLRCSQYDLKSNFQVS
jgi:hypothetical protein